MSDRYESFQEFWPFYLGEHSKASTRIIHFIGTSLGMALLVFAIATQRWGFIALGLVCSYGMAWVSHFTIEHNRPATFKYPLWSFMGDWKMLFYAVTGRLGGELARLGLARSSGRQTAAS